ncbi:MAG TPA: DUF432 domain-containing protein [Nitrosopumilaceae archaeon]|nr:DUF432 domain-containing protein [Nitrosopumilaceae archaeon]
MDSTKNFSIEDTSDSNLANNFSKYGRYTVKNDLELSLPDTKIKITKVGEGKFSYQRKNSTNDVVEKVLVFKTKDLLVEIAPSIPIHLPSYKTDFMFLRLLTTLHLGKKASTELDISVPIEVGLYGIQHDSVNFFDCFMCHPSYSKYGLYGNPEEGKLCKYAQIALSTKERPSPFAFAKMNLKITNELEKGIDINRIVFPITDHDIYYSKDQALLDPLHVFIKDRVGLEIAEVKNLVTYASEWTKSPRETPKTDYKYSMEVGFD